MSNVIGIASSTPTPQKQSKNTTKQDVNKKLKYFDGNGTEEDPYQIKCFDDLVALSDPAISEAGLHFIQKEHLILGQSFEKIKINFYGKYDGN